MLAWTANGVQRLTEEPGRPGQFTAGPLFTPRLDSTGQIWTGQPSDVEWSSQGFLVVRTGNGIHGPARLHLLPVPE